jgi:glucose/arabinose dehydrogenase
VGQIQRVKVSQSGAEKIQILDISKPSDGVFEQSGECGLLGAVLHPNLVKNPYLFVYYSLRINNQLHQRLSRFRISDVQTLQVDRTSEQPVITQADPETNHNGGDLHFGTDGYLYVSCGDGGASGDKSKNAGKINGGFFAAIYRLDVDKRPGSLKPNPHPSVINYGSEGPLYNVPSDNPFVGAITCRGVNMRPVHGKDRDLGYWITKPLAVQFRPQNGSNVYR